MPERDHRISLAQATALTQTWQKEHAGERKAWMFSREVIDEILAQPNCKGIRIYAAGTKDDVTVVVVGTDGSDKDMTDGPIGEMAWPCPPFCDEGSPLAGA